MGGSGAACVRDLRVQYIQMQLRTDADLQMTCSCEDVQMHTWISDTRRYVDSRLAIVNIMARHVLFC